MIYLINMDNFIYIAEDWTGKHYFGKEPILTKCGGLPDIWTGYKLKFLDNIDPYKLDIPKKQFIKIKLEIN